MGPTPQIQGYFTKIIIVVKNYFFINTGFFQARFVKVDSPFLVLFFSESVCTFNFRGPAIL